MNWASPELREAAARFYAHFNIDTDSHGAFVSRLLALLDVAPEADPVERAVEAMLTAIGAPAKVVTDADGSSVRAWRRSDVYVALDMVTTVLRANNEGSTH